jgi:hypothetical protein
MEENKIVQFFKKINRTVVDAQYLASQALSGKTKSVLLFFFSLFLISLAISAIFRSVNITKSAPEILVSAFGVLRFENNKLVSPDTLVSIDGGKINKLGALISGLRVPPSLAYPIKITAGTDSIISAKEPFVHIGESAFSSNVLSLLFNKKPSEIQYISWNKILPSPNAALNLDFYKEQFSKIPNKISIYSAAFIIIGAEMFSAILQIWISILIYLLFFGRKLKFLGRFRMLMLTAIPYFILMPVSLAAANGFAFTTDIALVGGLIMTFRAVGQLEPKKESGNEKK